MPVEMFKPKYKRRKSLLKPRAIICVVWDNHKRYNILVIGIAKEDRIKRNTSSNGC
jgi:hypothetical protein